MKKLFALLLALAMLLGCAAFAEAVDYVGTWVLTGIEANGIQMGPSMLSAMKMEMTMTFNADGTAVLKAQSEEAEDGKWAATETGVSLTDASGVTDVLVYRDEMLLIEQEGAAMMFTREGAAPAVAEESGIAVLANVDPKEFEGWWMLTELSMMDMELPAESLGMYMALKLSEGGGIIMVKEGEDEPTNAPVAYVISEVEGVGTVAVVSVVNEEAGLAEEVLRLSLRSDGKLVQKTVEGDVSVTFIFTRIAE